METADYCVAPWFKVEDGYPTDESLDMLRAQDAFSFEWWARFLVFDYPDIRAQMCGGADYAQLTRSHALNIPAVVLQTSTAGWSGVEDVIAIIESKVAARHFMQSWRRGGHYVFEIPAVYLPPGLDLAAHFPEQPSP